MYCFLFIPSPDQIQMRPILVILLFFVTIKANSQNHSDTTKTVITPKLGIQFGTIAKLEVQVIDGDTLKLKEYLGTFLLKIYSVNDKTLNAPVLMTFSDETESLASDDFQLYKLKTGKAAKSLSSSQIDTIKKKYAGQKLTLMAYETGHFTGIPASYFNYQPIRQDNGFHFRQYLIVVSNLTNKADK